jgi:hypothetical protein
VGDCEVCSHHYERIKEWFYGYRIELPAAEQRKLEEARQAAAEKELADSLARSIVYYLRRNDGLIKIGTTRSYKTRYRNLRSEHGELKLLLAHAGGPAEEAEIHRRHAADRTEGEWFRPSVTLLEAIRDHRRNFRSRSKHLPLGMVPLHTVSYLIRQARKLEEIKRARLERGATAAVSAARRQAKAAESKSVA